MVGRLLKVLFGAITFVVFLGFLFVEILANGGTTTTNTTNMRECFEQLRAVRRDGPTFHAELDPNCMSNRRIPNGPDPIHNGGAGQSKRPPGPGQAYP